ncbi:MULTISPECIES: restriction endonuclease [unclassified Novosphingobium]|uniref:restriction endonuclease n=1 Tax=unclassified Novosphingobium TaxID=2644732 RepID=UPI0025E3DDAB|nr:MULTISPECIES: restriction endonuclease [unclassified Novosphingobium]HQV03491.1 restriction endonuclease [Novosphingobium sp.]
MAYDWKDYQEETAEFFRSLGLSAETDVKLTGVRTTHDIDVVVKSKHVGFEVLWLVECKRWKSAVSKLHVLGLREIVNDLGADRGILLCEAGFQAGAVEAANLTNVQVTSLASLSIETRQDISAMRLRELYDRVEHCSDRYWELDKPYRKAVGLRPDLAEVGYSGARVVDFCRELFSRAFRGLYPIETGHPGMFVRQGLPSTYPDIDAVLEVVDSLTVELEGKLDAAYAGLSLPKK